VEYERQRRLTSEIAEYQRLLRPGAAPLLLFLPILMAILFGVSSEMDRPDHETGLCAK
jgi:hypothetical protein